MRRCIFTAILFLCLARPLLAQGWADVVVDQQGGGDFITIAEALESLPMFNYARVVILVRNGVYEEKLRIDRHYVTLQGESRDSTIVRFNAPRAAWDEQPDAIGPAVINIHADDAVLDNLTVENTQPEIGPHAFAVLGDGTRTVITRCRLVSKGADTVALWNYKAGMYYHADCEFEGAVDFLCPRGWCFVRDSRFYEVKTSAALWHAGHFDPAQKLVVVNSDFDGVPGFKLGRHHYEAQFILSGCRFSSNLSDDPIYRVTYADSSRNNPYEWGHRCYYIDCIRQGGNPAWMSDNFDRFPGRLKAAMLSPAWTFGGAWDPESTAPPGITNFQLDAGILYLTFNEAVTVRGMPRLVASDGTVFTYIDCREVENARLRFKVAGDVKEKSLRGHLALSGGEIVASEASVFERTLPDLLMLKRK